VVEVEVEEVVEVEQVEVGPEEEFGETDLED
jgi:hypothetical protein